MIILVLHIWFELGMFLDNICLQMHMQYYVLTYCIRYSPPARNNSNVHQHQMFAVGHEKLSNLDKNMEYF